MSSSFGVDAHAHAQVVIHVVDVHVNSEDEEAVEPTLTPANANTAGSLERTTDNGDNGGGVSMFTLWTTPLVCPGSGTPQHVHGASCTTRHGRVQPVIPRADIAHVN
jgi:hypothetical protein